MPPSRPSSLLPAVATSAAYAATTSVTAVYAAAVATAAATIAAVPLGPEWWVKSFRQRMQTDMAPRGPGQQARASTELPAALCG